LDKEPLGFIDFSPVGVVKPMVMEGIARHGEFENIELLARE
jgi:hypothetical protein